MYVYRFRGHQAVAERSTFRPKNKPDLAAKSERQVPPTILIKIPSAAPGSLSYTSILFFLLRCLGIAPKMAEAVASNATNTGAENRQSVRVLDELMSKLSVSKTADETSAAANNIAVFINGDIEEHDAPTKWVMSGVLRWRTGDAF